ncbi:hypothetical protein CBS101457_005516 [Exobasidium rhododendri]|nr:hypothetical protein CBS101457_005516 [Exobasidium rhododendri]
MSSPVCINCITGSILPGEPKGEIVKIGSYETYVAKPSAENVNLAKSAIVSFADVFGLSKNNKIVADLVSEQSGLVVYLPDLFDGKPLDPEALTMPTTTKEAKATTLLSKIGQGLKLVTVVPWVYRNWPASKMVKVEAYIKALKGEKSIEKLGAVGYCYGGKFAVDFNTKGLVNATVACHPSFTNLASYKDLKGPILFNCAETDDIFPDALRKQVQQSLDDNASAPAHDFKVFENCVHGFCARPNFGDELSKKGFEEGTQRTADWFKSHL